ncbi:hypothetical protein TEA_014554 [Camellia sinensis var. sinensis]|uniref:GH18 domain-containing protein n=1 Tax=Camellia sinensis var. sinensis TaxID=542762 RepID=A0A4S4E9V1_CAMSN|nr:hypothetical protein TEA_014554 [Camellia sinensis var. sinensis]
MEGSRSDGGLHDLADGGLHGRREREREREGEEEMERRGRERDETESVREREMRATVRERDTDEVKLKNSIAIYWGRDRNEGTLFETCDTKRFSYVIITDLFIFSDDSTDPLLRLDGHCNTTANGCAALSSDICHCQNLGIKVMLSIEGYSLESKSHAKNVSDYLWNNYLGGNSSSRPFGNAVLNGDALNTGLFDYVWVHFYNLYAGKLPCQYNNNTSGGDIHALLDSWKVWIRSTKGDVKVFMGLLALTEDVLSGFIPAEVLKGQRGYSASIKGSSNTGHCNYFKFVDEDDKDITSTIRFNTRACDAITVEDFNDLRARLHEIENENNEYRRRLERMENENDDYGRRLERFENHLKAMVYVIIFMILYFMM